MRKQRGYILMVTILLCGVVMALLLVLAPGVQFGNLQQGRENRLMDSQSARSGCAAVLSCLMYRPDFAEPVQWTPSQGQKTSLTFDSHVKDGYCLNNFANNSTGTGWDQRVVPAGQVHLVATGGVRHQLLSQPFQQVLVEDFDGDGEGGGPRLNWVHYPKTSGWLCHNHYMFLGSPEFAKNQAQWMMVPAPLWRDYDLEVHVAYYGTSSFGFSLRTQDGFEGYRLELQPKIGMGRVNGVDATVSAMVGSGRTEIPYSKPAQSLDDPLLSPDVDLSDKPCVWTLRASVRGQQISLAVWDRGKGEFHPVGDPWDLTDFADNLKTAGYPVRFDSGGIGIWANTGTGIAFTNVVVKFNGNSLMRVPARWED